MKLAVARRARPDRTEVRKSAVREGLMRGAYKSSEIAQRDVAGRGIRIAPATRLTTSATANRGDGHFCALARGTGLTMTGVGRARASKCRSPNSSNNNDSKKFKWAARASLARGSSHVTQLTYSHRDPLTCRDLSFVRGGSR